MAAPSRDSFSFDGTIFLTSLSFQIAPFTDFTGDVVPSFSIPSVGIPSSSRPTASGTTGGIPAASSAATSSTATSGAARDGTTISGATTTISGATISSATTSDPTRASTESSSNGSPDTDVDFTITAGSGKDTSTSVTLTPTPTVSVAVAENRSRNNLGPIIGGIVSSLVVLSLIAVLCYLLKRRRGLKPHQMKSLQETPTSRDATERRKLNLVANRMQDPLLDEAVEAGLMSRTHPAYRGRKFMN